MPVKNKNRQSNSGYEGVITGLNDEEKKVLEDAGIGGGSFNLFDCIFNLDAENFNSGTSYLTEVGLNKLNDMFVNGKLLGINDSTDRFNYLHLLGRNETLYMFFGMVSVEGIIMYVEIDIERQTGKVEYITKMLTTTDA